MPTVLITGANRGLGLEFARQYSSDGWRVIATARNPEGATELAGLEGDISVERLEMADCAQVASFHERLRGEPLDLFISNAGMMGPNGGVGALGHDEWVRTLEVNCVAPTILADTLVPNVSAAQGKMAALTSRMGSIADNGSGGYFAYRSSKAALNAAWHSMAIDLSGRVTVAVFHPGWVQTDMGGPNAQISPEMSVSSLRRLIAGLSPDQSGAFLDWDGSPIPW